MIVLRPPRVGDRLVLLLGSCNQLSRRSLGGSTCASTYTVLRRKTLFQVRGKHQAARLHAVLHATQSVDEACVLSVEGPISPNEDVSIGGVSWDGSGQNFPKRFPRGFQTCHGMVVVSVNTQCFDESGDLDKDLESGWELVGGIYVFWSQVSSGVHACRQADGTDIGGTAPEAQPNREKESHDDAGKSVRAVML